MKAILKNFGIFLLVFGASMWLLTRTGPLQAGRDLYRSIAESSMKTIFSKTSMYSEVAKMKDGRKGVFRLVMTNDAELQKQLKIAREQGLKKLDVEGKEFFVDYQLFFLTFWLFLVALIVATPIPLKSKLISLGISTLVFLLYSLIRLYILILQFLSNEVDIGIYQYNDFWSGVIKGIASTQKAGFVALVVFLIWLGFTARKLNWKKQLEEFQKQMKKIQKNNSKG